MRTKFKSIISVIILVMGSFWVISCGEEESPLGTADNLSGNTTKEPASGHTILLKGFFHKSGYTDPYLNLCTVCHGGQALAGDPGGGGFPATPSCTLCHAVNWGGTPAGPPTFTPPVDHTVSMRSRMHLPDPNTPYSSGCRTCHGTNLTGGGSGQPSCYLCHGQRWTESAIGTYNPPADHTVSKFGRMHKPGLTSANVFTMNVNATTASESPACQVCHGDPDAGWDLVGNPSYQGGKNPPSCYTCHGKKWLGTPAAPTFFIDIMSDHTVDKGDYAKHRPGFQDPFVSNFTATGYEGGPNHTTVGEGVCQTCHSPDPDAASPALTGGIDISPRKPPSCFTCHGDLWNTAGAYQPDTPAPMPDFNPSASHNYEGVTMLRGVVDHNSNGDNQYKTPFASNCVVCHQSDLEGGYGPPSCYTCHADEWVY